MTKEFNVLITGVGGQGVILISELLGEAAVKDQLKVRGSEILGMAVRGGSVTSAIRLGEDVYGPLIPTSKCSALVGMEPSEALRNITCLSKSSLVILNTAVTVPFTVPLGQSSYPSLEAILEKLNKAAERVIQLDAAKLAQEAGSLLTTNITMLGALFGTGRLPIKVSTIKEAIEERFPAKLAPVNMKAFDLGYESCRRALK
ncbi:MAG: indolepyruvate ferredoxin oxidoreductase subunit beta [Dehalococcoidales bacterium]|nr:indolepyruvate ferredoxin oxidoreductase subunit beta [Dehalococcoidales bacterium]